MATCKYCSKTGWFLLVDGIGLCDSCNAEHFPTIIQNSKLYSSSISIATKSKNPSIILSRLVVAAHCCRALEPYADRGLPTIGMHPREALEMLDESFDAAVSEAVQSITYGAKLKSRSASGDAGRLGAYGTALEKLMKLSIEFPAAHAFSVAANNLQAEQDGLRCELLLKKSSVAEAKGHTQKAIEYAIDAIMSLKHDTTPDELQLELIDKVRTRIVALGGTVPD